MTDYKQILINLCAGAYLADHMGDMTYDIKQALIEAGIITREKSREIGDLRQLAGFLALEHSATTLCGTQILDVEP